MIKRNFWPALITFLIFTAVTIYTGEFMAHVDGWDIIGYPLVFHKSCGRCLPKIAGVYTNYFYLLADVALIAIPVWTVKTIIRKK